MGSFGSGKLSGFSRALLGVGSAVLAGRNPARADLVAALGEVTGTVALRRLRDRMMGSADGAALIRNRQEISTRVMDPKRLVKECPPHSFGAVYAKFMIDRGFSPDDRPIVRFVDDPELAYIMLVRPTFLSSSPPPPSSSFTLPSFPFPLRRQNNENQRTKRLTTRETKTCDLFLLCALYHFGQMTTAIPSGTRLLARFIRFGHLCTR